MVKLREVRMTRLEGLKAFAAEMGVSYQHASEVYQGKRRSPRIEAALAEQGIKCRRPRRKA